MDPASAAAMTGEQPDVRLAKSVIEALRALPRGQAASAAGAISRIGKEPGVPLDPQRAGEAGTHYLVAVPTDADAPVVVYRRLSASEGGGYLVTGLGDREAFGALERTRPALFASRGGDASGWVEHPRSATPIHPVRLAPRPAVLVGREELLADLDTRLSASDTSGPRIVALCGLDGVGKTSLAVEYAHRHLAEVGLAWQFPAEDSTTLAAGFGELAAQLGVRDLLGPRDPVASVHGALAGYPEEWLLIFDNAPNPPSLRGYLPPAGHGRVLITSRDPFWPDSHVLNVPVLEPEGAADFLVSRTGDTDRWAALELANELGELPLALEQAAAYIQVTGNSLASYLALFRRHRVSLLARGGYGETVAGSLALALARLEESAPQAIGLLRLLAFCAPEAIPLGLMLRPRNGQAAQLGPHVEPVVALLLDDPLAADDAVAALRRYSLISAPTGGFVSVHRLVQVVTADQMPSDLAMEWRQATADLIEAAIPDDPRQPAAWPAYAALLPHAKAALGADSDSMAWIAEYLGFSGNYRAALALEEQVVNARQESRGAENPGTLAARNNLAYWTGLAGDAAGARDQLAALLPVYERVLGSEHPDTLAARNNLAQLTARTGDAAGARDQLAALLPVYERVLGSEHPRTLAARNNLAYWTGLAGDAAGARDQLAALLPVYERVLGSEHPDTLAARNNLAQLTARTGDAAGARDQLAALLPVYERVLGSEHPDTLAARNNLAYWTGLAGDAAGARDQLAALLPVYERVLGSEHPDTLAARNNLSYLTEQAESRRGRSGRRRS